jgi:hypothetical protein
MENLFSPHYDRVKVHLYDSEILHFIKITEINISGLYKNDKMLIGLMLLKIHLFIGKEFSLWLIMLSLDIQKTESKPKATKKWESNLFLLLFVSQWPRLPQFRKILKTLIL